jgi:tetratricopeptide (TPR) repeat protein
VTDQPDIAATSADAPPQADRRPTDLTLARLHLRTGSLALARAEFETLAGREEIDGDALVDLADVRWRTGDLASAGAAASSALDRGIAAPVAMIIAAESAFALGRPGEARRLATQAMTAAGGTLDALFAGMPRSSVWPPDPAEPAPSTATLFGDDSGDAAWANGEILEERRREDRRRAPSGPLPATAAGIAAASSDPSGPGLWDEDGETSATNARPVTQPAAMLESGLAALAAGETDRAAALLGVALRIGPHLAPSILDATIDADAPAILLVRGDALRATGHDADATAAYAAAATALEPPEPPDTPDGDVAVPYGPTGSTPQ